MKTVIILTTAYPYYPGEQFIEDEIHYWSAVSGVRVILVPSVVSGIPRKIPGNIFLNITIAKNNTKLAKIISLCKSLFSRSLFDELNAIKGRKNFILLALSAIKLVATTTYLTKELRIICARLGGEIIAYSYWSNCQAYSAVVLKNEGVVSRVVSRAHGYDLYEERSRYNYMPLKRQYIHGIDLLMPVSEQGANYLKKNFLLTDRKMQVGRLGVPIPNMMSPQSGKNCVNILSVSFCIKIKRIDKMINAIEVIAKKREDINFKWMHLGDGPLRVDLMRIAKNLLSMKNVSFEFFGQLSSSEVKSFYANNEIDIFLNTSESEGVPVSIMEAMSYGVPVVAPNIGGVSEIVDDSCGRLMSNNPDFNEIAQNIEMLISVCKDQSIRLRARNVVEVKYSAASNYTDVVDKILDY